MEERIDYAVLVEQAMRQVAYQALQQVQQYGLPGDHHFFISFNTTHPDVVLSDNLRSRYPEEMTIVLQHQFHDLLVEEDAFSVTLSFNNLPEKLVIPYTAMTAFADPSVKFGLRFQNAANHTHASETAGEDTPLSEESGDTEGGKMPFSEGSNVISLDNFRKK